MEKNRKAQAAMDLLLTYSWVLVVIIGILGALVATGVFDIGFLQQNKCEAKHPINCQQITITQNPGDISIDTVLHNLGANKLNISNLIFTDDEGNTCDSGTISNTLDTAKEIQIKFDCTNDLTSGKIKITYTNLNSKSGIQELSTGEYKISKIQNNDPYDDLRLSITGGETIVFQIADNSIPISSTNPIIILTASELSNISHTLTNESYTHFKLANNIDLTGFDTDTDTSNGNWAPIGSDSTPFKRSFDGGGFSITGLDISVSSDYVGLFGRTNGAIVSNVSVFGNVSTSGNRVGGLIGTADNSNVSFVSFSGNVSGGWHVGGLVGRSDRSLNISFSNSSGMVNGTYGNVGGLVGLLDNGGDVSFSSSSSSANSSNSRSRVGGLIGALHDYSNVSSSFASGSVSGDRECGGLVGNMRTASHISKSFASGSVNGNRECGGLVGMIEGTYKGGSSIFDSFSFGTVTTPSHTAVGRFVGEMRGGVINNSFTYSEEDIQNNMNVGFVGNFHTTQGYCENSYWDTTTLTGPLTINDNNIELGGCGNSAGKTTFELQTPTGATGIYDSWDATIWDFGTSAEYPTLIGVG